MNALVALGFTESLAMTVLSEVCDRMFCIAAAKTVISAMVAWAALSLLPKKWSHHVTTFLFFLFAPRSLWEGFTKDDEVGGSRKGMDDDDLEEKQKPFTYFSPVFLKLATISLAAGEDIFGVVLGGIVGQVLWTVAAVIGRKSLASRISERLVTLLGGFLFLVFGVRSLLSPS